MILIGNNNKIILPYFYSNDCFIELNNPFLKECTINQRQDRVELVNCGDNSFKQSYCGITEQEVILKFICNGVKNIEYNGAKDLFNSLSENLSIKELMGIVQDKLIKRKNNGRK